MLVNDLADYLSSGGVGTVGTDIFMGAQFGEADPSIAILLTGGSASVHTNRSGPGLAAIERPRVQIVTRSLNSSTAMTRAQAAFKLLDGMRERQINGIRYLWTAAVQPPFTLERDENNRTHVVFNVDVHRERST
jgi:hypothetical protein